MATQTVLDQTVAQLTALATPSTAVADIDTQLQSLYAQIVTLQAQRATLAPEAPRAQRLLRQLTQVVGVQSGPNASGQLVINAPSIAAVQAAQTNPAVLAPPST